MATRKQVVFCTDGIFPHAIGGMQRHSALLIEELARKGNFSIIVVHPHKEKVFDASLGIQEIPLDFQGGKGNYLINCYKYSIKVFKELRHFPDAIIYSQGLSVWSGISTVKDRLILNPHGLEPYQTIETIKYLKAWFFRLIFSYLFRKSRVVISLGGRLTGILNKITGNIRKIVVIPNAVLVADMPSRDFNTEVLNLLFVGRFSYNKGIHILMKAIADLNKEGYKNKLVFNLVGKGPQFDYYFKNFSSPNVHFLGFASDEDLMRYYIENDIFVFPTLYEGMPTVVLEAMAKGMPVIVSDTGATAELVDSKNGFLIEKNNVRVLKWAIQSYFQMNSAKRQALSEASYKRVKEKFTWQLVAQRHEELFNTFIADQ